MRHYLYFISPFHTHSDLSCQHPNDRIIYFYPSLLDAWFWDSTHRKSNACYFKINVHRPLTQFEVISLPVSKKFISRVESIRYLKSMAREDLIVWIIRRQGSPIKTISIWNEESPTVDGRVRVLYTITELWEPHNVFSHDFPKGNKIQIISPTFGR